jgi:acyl-CoA reductase-like NAD-dependent aldehyde dehydrogenase
VPAGPGTVDVGSMTTAGQVEVVAQHVDDAIAKGARALVGGRRGDHRGDAWYEPTVLVDVDHSMECMTEETFGPTLPVMKVRDADEAVRLANGSPYGLNAAVISKDTARAEAVARRLESGAVCINDALVNYTALELPMGGAKTADIGYRHGPGGIRKYCQQQSLLISKVYLSRDIHTYPYKARTSRLLTRMRLLYGRGRR